MPTIPVGLISTGGPVALLTLVVLMILTERLVPARTHRKLEKERDLWQAVALKAMGHADALLPGAQIATKLTEAFADAAAEESAT